MSRWRWWERTATAATASAATPTSPLLDDATLRQLERVRFSSPDQINAGLVGVHPGQKRIQAIEFSDYRGYAPGDDFRQIDWNAYARLGELFLKTSRSEENISVSLLLDFSRSMDWGSPNKLQFARALAAQLSAIGLLHHDSVRTFALHGDSITAGTQFHTPSALPSLVRELETFPVSESIALGACLDHFRRIVAYPDLTILLSDLLLTEDQLEALDSLRWSSTSIVMHIVSPQEVSPDFAGPVELRDVETGQMAMFDVGPALQEAYARHYAERTDHIARRCARNGIVYVEIASNTLLPDLIRLLWRSGVIKAA